MIINHDRLKKIRPIFQAYIRLQYLAFNVKLAYTNLADQIRRADPAPLPPARLRHRVHGCLDRRSFVNTGETLAQNIRDLCTSVDRDVYSFQSVLDFGAGAGRIMSHFRDAPKTCRLHGTDIDTELVAWCRDHLPGIRWSVNDHRPPLAFPDNTFDLILAVSVFTHLDENLQSEWLNELRRVALPGAVLIVTVHGEQCSQDLPPTYRRQLHARGMLFVTGATGRWKLDRLPDFYQTAYHTRRYIDRAWSNHFDILHYVERGINNHQDAVILRRPK